MIPKCSNPKVFKRDIGNDLWISYKWHGFGLKGQRSTLLGLTAIRRGFELYECFLVTLGLRSCRCTVSIVVVHLPLISMRRACQPNGPFTLVAFRCCSAIRSVYTRFSLKLKVTLLPSNQGLRHHFESGVQNYPANGASRKCFLYIPTCDILGLGYIRSSRKRNRK